MEENRDRDLAYIVAVQKQDTSAFEGLLNAYMPLLASLSTSVSDISHADLREVMAEAQYALYCAALSFDLNQSGLTFGLYAKICIRNRLNTLFLRRKEEPPLSLDELYMSGETEGMESSSPTDAMMHADDLQHLYGRIKEVLSPYEMSVFRLWIEEYSAKEIAAQLGRDEKSVTNAISRSLAKLRAALR